MIVVGIAEMVMDSYLAQQATSEAEQAVATITIILGLGMIAFLWFIVLAPVLVTGILLKKSSIVEKGPTGPLATKSVSTE